MTRININLDIGNTKPYDFIDFEVCDGCPHAHYLCNSGRKCGLFNVVLEEITIEDVIRVYKRPDICKEREVD